MNLPIIVIGGGGHAKVLIDILLIHSENILGFIDVHNRHKDIMGIKWIGTDDDIYKYRRDSVRLVNGIGSVKDTTLRKSLFEKFRSNGYSFMNVIHPSAIIASSAELAEGVQIMAGAVIQPGVKISENSIINTRSTIDHDCVIGPHVHIASGVTLSGGVHVGEGAHIGTGATVIQGIRIGKNSLIGAGAVVIRDVPEDAIVMGVPAREVTKHERLEKHSGIAGYNNFTGFEDY